MFVTSSFHCRQDRISPVLRMKHVFMVFLDQDLSKQHEDQCENWISEGVEILPWLSLSVFLIR